MQCYCFFYPKIFSVICLYAMLYLILFKIFSVICFYTMLLLLLCKDFFYDLLVCNVIAYFIQKQISVICLYAMLLLILSKYFSMICLYAMLVLLLSTILSHQQVLPTDRKPFLHSLISFPLYMYMYDFLQRGRELSLPSGSCRCRLRVVDVYGTEVQSNDPGYMRLNGIKGSENAPDLRLKQYYTFYRTYRYCTFTCICAFLDVKMNES